MKLFLMSLSGRVFLFFCNTQQRQWLSEQKSQHYEAEPLTHQLTSLSGVPLGDLEHEEPLLLLSSGVPFLLVQTKPLHHRICFNRSVILVLSALG
jgi:hypothetical protein